MRVAIGVVPLLVVLALGGAASAQTLEHLGQASPEQTARGQTGYWARTLGLSRGQAERAYKINLRFTRAASLAMQTTQTDAEKLQAIDAYGEARDADLARIFTASQLRRYQQVRRQMDAWAAAQLR